MGELGKWNLLTAPNPVNELEICRCKYAQILAVLLVNSFNVLRDHHANPGGQLGIWRLFAAGSLTSPLPAHRRNESAFLHIAALNGQLVTALQTCVWKLAQGLIEEKADMGWRDLVGGDVVAQLGIVRRILGVPGQVLARQLTLDQFRIFGEEEDAPAEPHLVRPLFDLALQK